MHGPGEGSGIGRDLEGRNEVLSVAHPSGMSAEKGQERILSGSQDAGAVCVSQEEQSGDKLVKYGEVQMLNWANCHHPPEIWMAICR